MCATNGPAARRPLQWSPRAPTGPSSNSCASEGGAMRTMIVYVHGLWQSGGESIWLRRRLAQDLDADARAFSYPSVADDASTNARELAKYLHALKPDTLHLIGHSLGSLVILKLFEEG